MVKQTNKTTKKSKRWVYLILSVVVIVGGLFLVVLGHSGSKISSTTQSGKGVQNPGSTNQSSKAINLPKATNTMESGTTRENPIPAGAAVDIGNEMIITVVKVVRPAEKIAMSDIDLYMKPDSNQEYVEVDLKVDCKKSINEKCNFPGSDVLEAGSDGQVTFVAEAFTDPSSEFSGGASLPARMLYIVSKGDTTAVLFYQSEFGNPIYFGFQ